MRFLMRWFSSDYRAGLGAEAAGDLVEAARRFAACGQEADLARVLQLRVAAIEDAAEAVATARRALAAATRAAIPLRRYQATLAEALAVAAERAGGEAAERQWREFAGLCLTLGWARRAGDALAALGDHDAAAEAYAQGGELEAMEGALAAERRAALAGVGRIGLVQRAASLIDGGRADEAWALLEAEAASGSDEGVAALRGRFPRAHRLDLEGPTGSIRLTSERRIEVGREPGLGLTVAVPSVSRRHVSVERTDDAVVITDLGSASGTLRGTIYLKEPLVLHAAGAVWLGGRCELRFEPVGPAWRIQAAVDGAAGTPVYLGARVELDGRAFVADGRWWRHADRVLTVGATIDGWTVRG